MKTTANTLRHILVAGLWAFLALAGSPAQAKIDGLTGTHFDLQARTAQIHTPDGASMLIWALGTTGEIVPDGAGGQTEARQYPAPTLIVNQGDTVTVTLTNANIQEPVSLVFPGMEMVSATGGVEGALTRESRSRDIDGNTVSGETVAYTFRAAKPGTYTYYSGTHTDLQVEMGLVGAIVVRPAGFNANNPTAYGDPGSAYAKDREYLFVLTEMDPEIHTAVEHWLSPADRLALDTCTNLCPTPGMLSSGFRLFGVDTTKYHSGLWFINGRNGPDTMAPGNWELSAAGKEVAQPFQPYSALPRMHPGDKVLLRLVGGGREAHPFHTHGSHHLLIARDGQRLMSGATDLAVGNFTQRVDPGATYDAVFTWSADNIGWDIYADSATHLHDDPDSLPEAGECPNVQRDATGHLAKVNGAYVFVDPNGSRECSHGKPIPVTLPNQLDLFPGGFFSGSPFLGSLANLPPGEGGLNLNGGLMFMWHSHTERELVNFNIFPGGMMTMLIIEPPGAAIDW